MALRSLPPSPSVAGWSRARGTTSAGHSTGRGNRFLPRNSHYLLETLRQTVAESLCAKGGRSTSLEVQESASAAAREPEVEGQHDGLGPVGRRQLLQDRFD